MSLSTAQLRQLTKPINPRRVMSAQGQSHVAAFDVIAHLTRVFGPNWSFDVVALDLVHERSIAPKADNPKDQGRWWVTYRCTGRLEIRDAEGNYVTHHMDAATGSAQNMPSPGDAHDFAVKNAVSYTIKRCAKNLGDQFGLSLYNKGSRDPLVGGMLILVDEDVEQHAQAPLTLGNDEVDVTTGEMTPVASEGSGNRDGAEVRGEASPAPSHPETDGRFTRMQILLRERFGNDRPAVLAWVNAQRAPHTAAVESTKELSPAEVAHVVAVLEGRKAEVRDLAPMDGATDGSAS